MYQLDLSDATGVSSHLCVPTRRQSALEKRTPMSMKTALLVTLTACLEDASVDAASLDMSTVTCNGSCGPPISHV
jgi:hypothetical protein